LSRLKSSLPETLAAAVKTTIGEWQSGGKMQRLWQRDASLWTGDDEDKWLGWLDITEYQIAHPIELRNLAKEVWSAGFKDILLLGMGGSSLCPEVLRMTFGKIAGYPDLHVLDSTDPAQVKAFESKIDIARALFIVSSKSGSTLEPNIFKQYFFGRTKQAVGADKAGSHFIAITDPGSKMQQVAEGDRFRHIFFGRASIGGRYSALSNFGMVPAAAMGVDTKKFLDRTQEMVRACGPEAAIEENPGAVLGIILGTAARNGRDKVTIITSPDISDLGAWLEQLLAESTGKVGKGIIPVDREELAAPEAYGNDRVFAYTHTEHATDVKQDAKVAALEQAGHAVLRISMADIYDLGAEFFRWEIATAVAGSILGINAFNQPDVEASKIATRNLTSEYEKTGSLPAERPVVEDGDIKLFTDEKNAADLAKAAGGDKSLAGYLKAHLGRIGAGDYLAVLGYIQMNAAHEKALQGIRHAVRDKKRVATCLGFGPRFLHSTGQAYKGGPNSGVFLQITCDDAVDLPVPGQKYTFGVVKAAQARGDFQVLAERGRRALRVHLHDVESGLVTLAAAVQKALE
jgi:glucose-6-phosphate isomerase